MTRKNAQVLEVCTKGLSQTASRNGINWIATELIQNAWDQEVSQVDMTIESVGHGKGKLTITDDDPAGFLDLTHAYTLFAESPKKGNPLQRGRFDLGEKLVIAFCIETGGEMEIMTTTGGYRFSKDRGRQRLRSKTERGSRVVCTFRASKGSIGGMLAHMDTLIPPTGFVTTINGSVIANRDPVAQFEDALSTTKVRDDGDIYKTTRRTTVSIYLPKDGEVPMLYEMGIPVVQNATKFHIDIGQKVPLNMERNSVTPAFEEKVCALVLNATHGMLDKDDVAAGWVARALESDKVTKEAVTQVMDQKYGKKRVAHDPNCPEASAAAAAKGYTVVYGGNHTAKAWGNVRAHSPLTTAPARFNDEGIAFHADGKDVTIPHNEQTKAMSALGAEASRLHRLAHGAGCRVSWVNDPRSYPACYGDGELLLNYRRLGKGWVDAAHASPEGFQTYLDLIIHELSHHGSSSHYADKFYRNCTRIGAAVAVHYATEGLPYFVTKSAK